jgi:hypothetical protein
MSPKAKPSPKRAGGKEETGKTKTGRSSQPAVSPRPGRGAQVIGVKLPLAYLRILETEAGLFSARRGQFLEMLLRRKRGEISFDRSQAAPSYEATEHELRTMKLYMWYTKPEVREQIDADRLRMGNIGVAAWIVALINQWLGTPEGLKVSTKSK